MAAIQGVKNTLGIVGGAEREACGQLRCRPLAFGFIGRCLRGVGIAAGWAKTMTRQKRATPIRRGFQPEPLAREERFVLLLDGLQ